MGRSSLALLLLLLLSCCGQQPIPGNVKVWFLEPSVGLVRKQANQTLPFSKAKGYFCESPEDLKDTVSCVGGAVKVWKLDPNRGLVRSQANQVKAFNDARGYYCVSPADMKEILDRCV